MAHEMAGYAEDGPSAGATVKHAKASAKVGGGLECALRKILSLASGYPRHPARDPGINFDGRDVSHILRDAGVPFIGVDLNSNQFEAVESMGFRKVGNTFDSGPPGSLVLFQHSHSMM
jgi:hypothetical protein